MVGEKHPLILLVVTMQKASRIKKHITWCTMGIVNEVQQLDDNAEMSLVT
jgi:hypothetical protein